VFRRGFTLIELLIVVAIIAILAAIAVPNFLEAQTRAKVSRVKADIRSITTAIESYAVDNNKYPFYNNPLDSDYATYNRTTPGTLSHFEHRVPVSITTPIAYMTSLLNDVFVRKATGTEPSENAPHPFHYSNDQDNSADPAAASGSLAQYPVRYLYTAVVSPPAGTNYANNAAVWLMFSHGPDLVDNNPDDSDPTRPPESYDPTNGTVSSGDVYYFGPGLGFK
jgi:prepilin-type N-terminal cleavage/methylation domain-containing protein